MANRLQALREDRGLTLRDLAARVGTSNQQISHLELGKRQLTTDWLVRLASVLDCHPWEIVEEAKPLGLSEREQRLLANFRLMTDDQQSLLLAESAPQSEASGARQRRKGG